jgi:hypothetical protein
MKSLTIGIKEMDKNLFQKALSKRQKRSKTLAKYPESGKLTEKPLIRAKIIKDYYLFTRSIKLIYL